MNNSETQGEHAESEIAIIGMVGRFPGAANVDEFWQKLRDGEESITFFDEEELQASGVPASALKNPAYVKAASILEGVELLDAPFFGINPKEAAIMDPQHRLFLECAWEALEDAGYDPEKYGKAIGVYAGVSMSTYLARLYASPESVGATNHFQILLANDKDHLPTRVSYKLNLKGPSINVQTSCSTSLVSVHLACQALLNGECDMALAGGASVKVPQRAGYFYLEGGINSPDGHCRAFDRRAQGTVGGNGVGIVVLKRLPDALADGDQIRAVIKGSALNNDGALKVGYTAPSVEAQAQVIAEALAVAGVEPESVSYIEAHGTGTALGDPIEVAALTKAFRRGTERKGFCAVGSVKTNVGHLDAAAGVTGLIKTVLALQHRMIPPSLHYEEPNPEIDFADSPFYVNARLAPWESATGPRRAGVSSFGIGGTNAHVVVEEAPALEATSEARAWQLLVVSAKTESALEAATNNLASYLERHRDAALADVAYTLQVGRRAFEHRRALVCRDPVDALDALKKRDKSRLLTDRQKSRVRPLALMFPGQGSQYVRMGRGLYGEEEAFRTEVDRCAELLKTHLGYDLRDLLYPVDGEVEAARRRLDQTANTQPALFVVEYALARLWMSRGLTPEAMIGHSIGEYVAACLAGVFSLEDALALVAARGRLMQQTPKGAMLAVELSEPEAARLAGAGLSLAAVNGEGRCVLSGPEAAIEEVEKVLTQRGVASQRLHTSHAFHSELMEPALDEFAGQVRRVSLKPPRIPYVSNLSGTWVAAAEATSPDYWVKHLRHTVRFSEGLAALLADPERVLLEVGPGRTLSGLARRHPSKTPRHAVVSTLQHPQGNQPDEAFLLKSLGQLWLAGVDVDWNKLHQGESRRRLRLPTYPFERQSYWVGPPEDGAATRLNLAPTQDAAPESNATPQTSAAVTTARPRADEAARHPPAAPPLVTTGASPARQTVKANGRQESDAESASVERIVAQQLEIISAQLDVLREAGTPAKAPR